MYDKMTTSQLSALHSKLNHAHHVMYERLLHEDNVTPRIAPGGPEWMIIRTVMEDIHTTAAEVYAALQAAYKSTDA